MTYLKGVGPVCVVCRIEKGPGSGVLGWDAPLPATVSLENHLNSIFGVFRLILSMIF